MIMDAATFLRDIAKVNPNEKIDTNDDSFWILSHLLESFLENQ